MEMYCIIPGGWAAICSHAGGDASRVFHGIHSADINQQKEMWSVGRLVPPLEQIKLAMQQNKSALQPGKWVTAKLIKRIDISNDTRKYTYELPGTNDNRQHLGLPIGQHMLIGANIDQHGFTVRPYTSIRPIGSDKEDGTMDLVVKTYFPIKDEKTGEVKRPGGLLTMYLEEMSIGDSVQLQGPTGNIIYHGNGHITIDGTTYHVTRIGIIVGGMYDPV